MLWSALEQCELQSYYCCQVLYCGLDFVNQDLVCGSLQLGVGVPHVRGGWCMNRQVLNESA